MPESNSTTELGSVVARLESELAALQSRLDNLARERVPDDGLVVGAFAMQGKDVVRICSVDETGTFFGIDYCQGWRDSFPEIPVRGGSSFSWIRVSDYGTVWPADGPKSPDRWGIRPIEDPILRLRAELTRLRLEARDAGVLAKRRASAEQSLLLALQVASPGTHAVDPLS